MENDKKVTATPETLPECGCRCRIDKDLTGYYPILIHGECQYPKLLVQFKTWERVLTELAPIFVPEQCVGLDNIVEVVTRIVAERNELKERLEVLRVPGKMETFLLELWDIAEQYGHSQFSSKHALTFLRQKLETLTTERNALAKRCKELEAKLFYGGIE